MSRQINPGISSIFWIYCILVEVCCPSAFIPYAESPLAGRARFRQAPARTNVSLMFSPHLLETPHEIVREVGVSRA